MYRFDAEDPGQSLFTPTTVGVIMYICVKTGDNQSLQVCETHDHITIHLIYFSMYTTANANGSVHTRQLSTFAGTYLQIVGAFLPV